MNNKRRGRHDIVAEILHYARGGKLKTHIMYKTRLSYYQIQDYFPLLIEKGFLENTTIKQKGKITRIYRTTKKGMEFLEHLESVNKLWS